MKAKKDEYTSALDVYNGLCRMSELLSDQNDPVHEDRISSFNLALRTEVPPGLYEHFKSVKGDAKFYLVHSATLEVNRHTGVVTYASLYGSRAGMWTHRDLLPAADGFLSPIDRPAYRGPRFRLIQPLSLRQMADILDYVGELKLKTDPVVVRMFIAEILKKKVPMF